MRSQQRFAVKTSRKKKSYKKRTIINQLPLLMSTTADFAKLFLDVPLLTC